jgi:hypothetical protein
MEGYMQAMLSKEVPLDSLLSKDQGLMITDAKPYNEYFLLRRMAGGGNSLLAENIVKLIKNPIPK